MYYDNFHFWGMHLIWRLIWAILLIWIFAKPYDIPGQKTKKHSALNLLKHRFAAGQIDKEEYHEMKKTIEG